MGATTNLSDRVSEGSSGHETANEEKHREITINSDPTGNLFGTNEISTAKYRFHNFLPKFLFDQFKQYSNLFFLFVACMQQIPGVSPTGRHTTLVPLLTILGLSAIKELVEDFKRHLDDHETNQNTAEALRRPPDDGRSKREWMKIMWREVVVGDFLRVTCGQYFPADMVLLSSSDSDRMCHVETSNLDGESNLKVRQAPAGFPVCEEIEQLEKLVGVIRCENPNRHLYEFNGNVQLERGHETIVTPISADAVLLRGSKLENTDWIFGFVIYTGSDSKLMMNTPSPQLKRSTLEKVLNQQMTMMFVVLVIISLVSAVASSSWRANVGTMAWYIPGTASANFVFTFVTFVILYNNLIPISLAIALQIVRYVQASFINNDPEMYSEETDTAAKARTSNLNEELGLVEYIFSDKTGTLTLNIMEFKCFSLGTQAFGSTSIGMCRSQVESIMESNDRLSAQMRDFLTIMAVCHTAVPHIDKETGSLTYQAASPDETGLLKGAAELGFSFESRKASEIVIDVFGTREVYEILNVIDFTSTRKRMSIIVRRPDSRVTLMCKGADSVIYKRLAKHNQRVDLERVHDHLLGFANDGLRTLCMASRDIDSEELSRWQKAYVKANSALTDRERKVARVADLIERDLILHGASAIEDRLQEGVPETIAALLQADIRIWVLTGDKQETAINVGYSTRLLEGNTELVFVNETTARDTRRRIKSLLDEQGHLLQQRNNLGLVIDGASLEYALGEALSVDFQVLSLGVKVVICCRVSPKQKAEIVNLVRQKTKAVTLAIGDGANDVAMIQAAHVGVGISGVEGLQAACASDYSIPRFKYLRRLLFVHGAWNYARQCKVITYTFHKNICLYLIGMWFAIYSGWSGQTLFERWTFAMYNLLFTGAPPVAIGLFDRGCNAESMMSFPELYRANQREHYLDKGTFWMLIANSVYHSLVIFFISKGMMTQDVAWSNGRDGGYLVLGNMCYTYVVITMCLKAGVEIRAWSWPVHVAILGSIGCWFLFLITYSEIWGKEWISAGAGMSGMAAMVLSSKLFWLGCALAPAAALLLDVSLIAFHRTVWKTLTMVVREFEAQNREVLRASANVWPGHALSENAEIGTRSATDVISEQS